MFSKLKVLEVWGAKRKFSLSAKGLNKASCFEAADVSPGSAPNPLGLEFCFFELKFLFEEPLFKLGALLSALLGFSLFVS